MQYCFFSFWKLSWESCHLLIVITTTEVTELEQGYFPFIFSLHVLIHNSEMVQKITVKLETNIPGQGLCI